MNKKIIVWTIVLLLAFQLVTALGIRPAKTTIIYEETPVSSRQFWVVNNDRQELDLVISAEGELEKYLTLTTKEVTLTPEDDFKPVYFEIDLPENLPSGEALGNIVVEQRLTSTEEGLIASKLVLKHKIIAVGDYPDKYIAAKLNFHDQGDKIEFVSEVENLGKEDISEIQTTFYINDKEQRPHSLQTEKLSLSTKETTLLRASLKRDLFQLGEFEVSAVTSFDDQKIELRKILRVGQPEVEITYFDPYFIAYKINQYSLDLLNKWNTEVKNVFVDVEVKKDGKKIDEFRTKSVDIEGEMIQRITDYLDAKDKEPGKYTFEMVVNFWNTVRMDQKTFKYESEFVSEKEAEDIVRTPPLVGQAVAVSGAASTSTSTILLWVIIGILLGGIGFYVVYRYFHKEEYD